MTLVKNLHKLAGEDRRFPYVTSDPAKQDGSQRPNHVHVGLSSQTDEYKSRMCSDCGCGGHRMHVFGAETVSKEKGHGAASLRSCNRYA